MKIVVPDVDGRTVLGDMWHPVIDTDSGETVGHVRGHQGSQLFGSQSWEIELFDKQHRGSFDRLAAPVDCKKMTSQPCGTSALAFPDVIWKHG
jgi:hypothetical protein